MYPGLKTEWITAHNYKRIWRILITAFYKVRKNISLWREDDTKFKDLNSSFCVLFFLFIKTCQNWRLFNRSSLTPWEDFSKAILPGHGRKAGHLRTQKAVHFLPHDFPLGFSMHWSLLNYTETLKFNSVNKLGWALEGMTQGHRWDRKKRT